MLGLVAAVVSFSCTGAGRVAVMEEGKDSIEEMTEGKSCKAVCQGVECGVLGSCDCGACPAGFSCSVDNVCVSEAETSGCESLCKALGMACGMTRNGCNCGSCPAFADCVDGVCVERKADVESDFYYPSHEDVKDVAEIDECWEVCEEAGYECGEIYGCWCGQCDYGYECNLGQCIPLSDPCQQACAQKECGTVDGCECGTCGDGLICNENNECEPAPCQPICQDPVTGEPWECGDDSCGSTCGFCLYGECIGHVCICTPACAGKQCGPDGCGGSCGVCPDTQVCGWDSQCHGSCDLDDIVFSQTVQKVTTLAVGKGGHPGEALDVDKDPATCAPKGNCEFGLDNQMSSLFNLLGQVVDVDKQFKDALNSGEITMLLEFVLPDFTGKPFVVNAFLGEPVKPKSTCNFQTSFCEYYVMTESIDVPNCKPFISFDNAKIVDGVLYGGGPGYQLLVKLPLMPGIPFKVELHHAQIFGTILSGETGVDSMTGVLAGALVKQKLLDAIDTLPSQGLPVSKELIKNLLDVTLQLDQDTDGDGIFDATSVGFKFSSIAGKIVGVK